MLHVWFPTQVWFKNRRAKLKRDMSYQNRPQVSSSSGRGAQPAAPPERRPTGGIHSPPHGPKTTTTTTTGETTSARFITSPQKAGLPSIFTSQNLSKLSKGFTVPLSLLGQHVDEAPAHKSRTSTFGCVCRPSGDQGCVCHKASLARFGATPGP